MQKEMKKKYIQQEPKSIIRKEKIGRIKNKIKIIPNIKPFKVEFKPPNNIKLGGISNIKIDDDEDKKEKNIDEEDEEEDDDDDFNDNNQNEIILEDDEDINDDYIIYNNNKNDNKKIEQNINSDNTKNINKNINSQIISNSMNPQSSTENPPGLEQNPSNSTIPKKNILNILFPPKETVSSDSPKVISSPQSSPSSDSTKIIEGRSGTVPPPPPLNILLNSSPKEKKN